MNALKAFPILRRSMSSSVAKKLDFYYDVISPYSWLAFEVLLRYQKRWNIDLNLCPTLLGGIFKQIDNSGPLVVPAKVKYMRQDVARLRASFDVPIISMKDPTYLRKTGSLAPMRFLTAVKMNLPQYLEEASRVFWMIRWNKDQDVNTQEALKEVCQSCKMSEAESNLILEKIKSAEVKAALVKSCKDALDCDIFGVPSTVIHKDEEKIMIFGSDRFPIIAELLGEEWKGLNPDKVTKL